MLPSFKFFPPSLFSCGPTQAEIDAFHQKLQAQARIWIDLRAQHLLAQVSALEASVSSKIASWSLIGKTHVERVKERLHVCVADRRSKVASYKRYLEDRKNTQRARLQRRLTWVCQHFCFLYFLSQVLVTKSGWRSCLEVFTFRCSFLTLYEKYRFWFDFFRGNKPVWLDFDTVVTSFVCKNLYFYCLATCYVETHFFSTFSPITNRCRPPLGGDTRDVELLETQCV